MQRRSAQHRTRKPRHGERIREDDRQIRKDAAERYLLAVRVFIGLVNLIAAVVSESNR